LAFIVVGGNVFVDNAAWMARRLGLSEFAVGVGIVGIGTTLPELFVSVTAAARHSSGIAYGNVVGSIIANAALIAGLVLVMASPLSVDRSELRHGSFFFLAGFTVFTFAAMRFGQISRATGIVLAFLFALHMFFLFANNRDASCVRAQGSILPKFLALAIGGAAMFLGSRFLVDNTQRLAVHFGVAEKLLGLTLVAIGTSLPELATAVIAIVRRHSAMSLGNLIGANVLNITLVPGFAAIVSPIAVEASSGRFELAFAAAAMLLLCVPLLKKKCSHWLGGIALLGCFAVYLCFIL
jgi:cation:H+ antiporter